MKTIKPNQDFKHGRQLFQEGQEYEVSDEDAAYFTEERWVGEQPDTFEGALLEFLHAVVDLRKYCLDYSLGREA